MNAYARQSEGLDVKPALWQAGLHSQQPWDSKRYVTDLLRLLPLFQKRHVRTIPRQRFLHHMKAPENHLDFPGLYHAQLTMRVG